MAKLIIPAGFVTVWYKDKPGIRAGTGMFWKINEEKEVFFLCDNCSLKKLKAMDPPLTKIEKGWEAIREELYERGYNVAPYEPKTSIVCEECGLIISDVFYEA